MLRTTLLVVVLSNFGECLLCSEILDAPETKKWSLTELRTAPPKEIIECIAHIAKERMTMDEAEYIWQTMIKFYDGVVNIPDEKIAMLRWVTVALSPDDYLNISLSNVDVVENFGLDYQLSPQQLGAIAERIREDWGGKEPEDYTCYDLSALKNILCAFNKSEIERIRPAAYKEAASVLSNLSLTSCRKEVLEALAWLAIQDKAFGAPAKWSKAVVDTVGVVAYGLPPELAKQIDRRTIPPNSKVKY